jgi:antitoxin VapB
MKEVFKQSQDFLNQVFTSVRLDLRAAADETDGGCVLNIDGADAPLLRSEGGELLDALEHLVNQSFARGLEPGETEAEVARRLFDALAARGMRSVVTLVAADERIAKFRHPVPTTKTWERVVMLVTCARRQGLVASLSRIVCAGGVPEELKRRMNASARVNAKLLAATRPGALGSELYRVAADAYAEEGFPGEERLHHQGGAAGYRTRDWVAHPASTETVQNSQAFAWNPTVTGSKAEETCIASAEGVEVITTTPDWPQIPVRVGGREYLSPDVLPL